MTHLEACNQIVKELRAKREYLKNVKLHHEMEITRLESPIRALEQRFLELMPSNIPQAHVYREEDTHDNFPNPPKGEPYERP